MSQPVRLSPRHTAITALCCVAGLQITLGLAGLAAAAAGVEWERATAVRDWQRAIEIVVFSLLAGYLLQSARRDTRTEALGGLLLLIAVSFAHDPILALANALPAGAARVVLIIRSFVVEAFTPTMAWLLVRDFPRALAGRRSAQLVNAIVVISIVAGVVVLAANLTIGIRGEPGALAPLDRTNPYGFYQAVVFGLLLPVLPSILWRMRHARLEEKRRVRLFTGGLGVFALPSVLFAVLPPLHPALSTFAQSDWSKTYIVPFLQVMLLSMAATTTYSVAVQQVLDVRTVVRKAAQYGLARGVVALLAGIPFAMIIGLLYRARGEPIANLFAGVQMLQIVALLAVGFLTLRLRQRVMLAVDRIFFREAYDPREVLAAVTTRSREAHSTRLLGEQLMQEIDRAIHVDNVGMLVSAPERDVYLPLDGALRSLAGSSALIKLLAQQGKPMPIDLDRPSEPLRHLSMDDRSWLADAEAHVLVPLAGAAGDLAGLLCLGPKRNELPFSREDLLLLDAVGGATGIALENRLLRDSATARRSHASDDTRASECLTCGRVGSQDPMEASSCAECGGAQRPAALPLTLGGKFQLEQRLGEGGMGIVYRAVDLTLGRPVALKTLPATSPEDAGRLRREARAMAAITHPHLALIHGAETWRGTPVLVLEYLGGGTLADRLSQQPMATRDALELAHVMAGVLERAHGAGILHRDVKPSNIGFTTEGEPKLLDFGLVQITAGAIDTANVVLAGQAATVTGFAGTPLYMSPAALNAERAEPGFDLWGLAVVAFEAVAGSHPFERNSWAESYAAIQRGWCDELRGQLQGPAAKTAELFERALAREPSRRPAVAGELARDIRTVLDGST